MPCSDENNIESFNISLDLKRKKLDIGLRDKYNEIEATAVNAYK